MNRNFETMNNNNLIPIKKGEKRALKAPQDRKSERIPVQVTKAHKQQLEANAKAMGLSVSAYLLKDK